MAVFQFTFKRYERKYLITEEQYSLLLKNLEGRMVEDKYARSLINNIYYDTPDFLLIRRSIEKPVYKEKLRVRSYGVPGENDKVFVEIKKKYKKVVYKRRIHVPLAKANAFLAGQEPCPQPGQIGNEIAYFLSYYKGIAPAMFISYERYSLASPTDSVLRITFDRNIIWRLHDLDLTKGVYGTPLQLDGKVLMEVKIPDAAPMWLSALFDDLGIMPTSFSKYGRAYGKALTDGEIRPEQAAALLLLKN
ncbi:MAG: polyphosphate polymerase domain-containing protein [Clostridia bacterium]|nr:polyphosphate polymerase domain-containing protein [Clostridia bacterium]